MKLLILLIVAPVFSVHPEEKALVVSVGEYPNWTPTIVVIDNDAIFLRGPSGDSKTTLARIHDMKMTMQDFQVEFLPLRIEKEKIWTKKIIFMPRVAIKSKPSEDKKSKLEI